MLNKYYNPYKLYFLQHYYNTKYLITSISVKNHRVVYVWNIVFNLYHSYLQSSTSTYYLQTSSLYHIYMIINLL